MKRTVSRALILAIFLSSSVQAGFWESLKKGLGINSGGSAVAETAPSFETSNALPPPVAEPIPAQIDSVSPAFVHPSDTIIWKTETVTPSLPEGTVIDSATGLMWMRCAMGQTWINSTCSGTASKLTWNEANNLQHSFAGYQDWRLPTIRELQTLVEPGKNNPAINSDIFPETLSSFFWSGSPSAVSSNLAWYVGFGYGYAFSNSRGDGNRVRLVRGGQSLALLSEPSSASKEEIQKLIRHRTWRRGVETDYAKLAETHLRQAQTAHQALPEHLKAMSTQLSVAPSAPPKLTKDEFETTTAFQARIAKAQTAYEAKVADYNRQVASYERQVKDHYAQLGPLPDEQRQQAIRTAFLQSYAAPALSKLRYDADAQTFFAVIADEAGSDLSKHIAIRDIPPDEARRLRSALEAAKPEVHFRINADNSLTWEAITLRVGTQKLAAVPVNSAGETQRVEVAIKALEVSTPNIVMPQATALQKTTFDIRDDPTIAAQQAEIDRIKRQRSQVEAKAAEQKRLKEELARLQQSMPQSFNDDLQPLLARAPAAKADKRLHVLAIGIDDYADVPDVPFADRSAKLFAEMARKTLGAQPENIITLTNQEATSGRLRGRLRTLLGRLTPEDRLLIYFAGHGVPAQDGKNVFLLAQDGGSGSFEEPDLQLNALYAQVDRSRVGQAQLFIDACFSGRSNKDSMILGGTAGVAIVPKHGIRSDSRLTVMIAGRAEQLSNQHEERGHRLFGYHLMHAMLKDGLKLSAGELHSQIRGKVLADSLRLGPEFAQEPELLGNSAAVLKR